VTNKLQVMVDSDYLGETVAFLEPLEHARDMRLLSAVVQTLINYVCMEAFNDIKSDPVHYSPLLHVSVRDRRPLPPSPLVN